jgi:hypothetical protein
MPPIIGRIRNFADAVLLIQEQGFQNERAAKA